MLTLQWKLIGAGVLVVFVLMAARWYGNRQYAAGREEERAATAQILAKAADKARDEARAELQQQREAVQVAVSELNKVKADLQRQKVNVDAELRSRLAAIQSKLQEEDTRVVTTLAGDLPDLVRQLNAELRAGR